MLEIRLNMKNRWYIFSSIISILLIILFFNLYLLNRYNDLISSRLDPFKITDISEVRNKKNISYNMM